MPGRGSAAQQGATPEAEDGCIQRAVDVIQHVAARGPSGLSEEVREVHALSVFVRQKAAGWGEGAVVDVRQAVTAVVAGVDSIVEASGKAKVREEDVRKSMMKLGLWVLWRGVQGQV